MASILADNPDRTAYDARDALPDAGCQNDIQTRTQFQTRLSCDVIVPCTVLLSPYQPSNNNNECMVAIIETVDSSIWDTPETRWSLKANYTCILGWWETSYKACLFKRLPDLYLTNKYHQQIRIYSAANGPISRFDDLISKGNTGILQADSFIRT